MQTIRVGEGLYSIDHFGVKETPKCLGHLHPYVARDALDNQYQEEIAVIMAILSVYSGEWVGVSLEIFAELLAGRPLQHPQQVLEIRTLNIPEIKRNLYYLVRNGLLKLDRKADDFVIYPTPELVERLRSVA